MDLLYSPNFTHTILWSAVLKRSGQTLIKSYNTEGTQELGMGECLEGQSRVSVIGQRLNF